MTLTTRKMSDRHEADLADWFDGRVTRGSGNQFNNPADGRNHAINQTWALAWDGKSTRGKSLSVNPETWRKLEEQAHDLRPMLPLRWYTSDNLDVGLDLAVFSIQDAREMIDTLRGCTCQG